jgi:hypothetical protein
VITSLLENAVILETIKKKRGASVGGHLHLPSSTARRHVCLGGALARPCTILVLILDSDEEYSIPKHDGLDPRPLCVFRRMKAKVLFMAWLLFHLALGEGTQLCIFLRIFWWDYIRYKHEVTTNCSVE